MSSSQIFVSFPSSSASSTDDGAHVIFGQNSVGPKNDIHEVVLLPAACHDEKSVVKCTYKEIAQVATTHAVVLSRPSGSWGAESGANEHGLVIGWSSGCVGEAGKESLTGLDLVRLGLERSRTSSEALHTITTLLTSNCEGQLSSDKHTVNCFLIVDQSEAWIVECVGRQWAAECIKNGVRSLTGSLTIHEKIDKSSPDLKQHAIEQGWWSESDTAVFDFADVYNSCVEGAENKADSCQQLQRVLQGLESGSPRDMLQVLREPLTPPHYFINSSHMSVLSRAHAAPGCHWFTATPDPTRSLFKPFIFTEHASLGDRTACPVIEGGHSAEPVRGHALWTAHEEFLKRLSDNNPRCLATLKLMRELEENCLQDVSDMIHNYGRADSIGSAGVAGLFQHIVNLEMNFY